MEEQLKLITNKADMHKKIDEMSDKCKAILLVMVETDVEKEIQRYSHFGPITVAESYYLAGTYQVYLLGLMKY